MKKGVSVLFVIFIIISIMSLFSGCIANKSIDANNQSKLCEKIAQNLSVNEIDMAAELSYSLEAPLSDENKSIIMQALEKRLNNRIESILKSFASTYCLVSEETISEVELYKTIITNVGITDSDYTNIDDYIESVLALESYKKYNDIWSFWEVALGDWNNGNQYWENAVSSYSDYMINTNLEKSLDSFNSCVNIAENYNQSSFGISEAKNMAAAYVYKIEYYFDTGNDLTVDNYTLESFSLSQDEFNKESNNFLNELRTLPISVYYEK